MKDFLIYGSALIISITLLYFFIKTIFTSLRNEIKKENENKELLAKIEAVNKKHNDLIQTQHDLNVVAQHEKLLNNK